MHCRKLLYDLLVESSVLYHLLDSQDLLDVATHNFSFGVCASTFTSYKYFFLVPPYGGIFSFLMHTIYCLTMLITIDSYWLHLSSFHSYDVYVLPKSHPHTLCAFPLVIGYLIYFTYDISFSKFFVGIL